MAYFIGISWKYFNFWMLDGIPNYNRYSLKQFSANGTHLKYGNGKTCFEIFYVQAEKAGSTKIMLPYNTDDAVSAYEISGNNVDGFVVTCFLLRQPH